MERGLIRLDTRTPGCGAESPALGQQDIIATHIEAGVVVDAEQAGRARLWRGPPVKQGWTWRDTAICGALVACLLAFLGIGSQPMGCEDLHVKVALAGDAQAANAALANCPGTDRGDIWLVLAIDTVFAVEYGLVLTVALLRWWERGWRVRPLRPARQFVRWLPGVAAALDMGENAVLAFAIDTRGQGEMVVPTLGDHAAELLSVLSWWKLGAASLAVLAVLLSLIGTIGYLNLPTRPSGPTGDGRGTGAPEGDGIALSGGGIRAASFALGAVQGLDGGGHFRSARFVSAASGGAYTGVAWYIARGTPEEAADVQPQPAPDRDSLLSAEQPAGVPNRFEYIRMHRRYLATGRGGLPLSVIVFIAALALHLLLISTAVFLAAWPVGRFAASSLVVPDLRTCDHARPCDALPGWALARPVLLPAVVALTAFVAALFLRGNAHRRALAVAAGAAGAAAIAALALLVVPVAVAKVPMAMRELSDRLPNWLPGDRDDTSTGSGLLGLLSGLGLTAALGRLALKPVQRAAPRLGASS